MGFQLKFNKVLFSLDLSRSTIISIIRVVTKNIKINRQYISNVILYIIENSHRKGEGRIHVTDLEGILTRRIKGECVVINMYLCIHYIYVRLIIKLGYWSYIFTKGNERVHVGGTVQRGFFMLKILLGET